MAVLTRPLFHAQERIDLEDFNQILSGLRTDSRLWVRQVYADKNLILKGFEATGINTNQLSVNIFDSTLLFAGRRDLTGVAEIVISAETVDATVVTIFNSDGNQLTFTSNASDDTGTNWVFGNVVATVATSLARAIATIDGLSTSVSGGTITVTTTNTGFTNITATPQTTGFVTVVGDIISSFDYAADIVESPGDLSYFIVQSSITGTDAILTSEITAGQRADSTQPSKSLSVYATLGTESGTPITKAFWDPSANGGAGGEFNQRVNTATDLVVSLRIEEGAIDESSEDFFSVVPVCDIDVDSSGTIIAIRDVRPLMFEADDNFELNQTTPFVTIGLTTTVPNGFNLTATLNSFSYIDGETINITDGDGMTVRASSVLTENIGDAPNDSITLEKFDLSQAPARQRLAVGATSGAIRIIDSVSSNFFRDDKSLGNFRDTISTIATEIRKIKGTERWYEDPAASIAGVLRFVNSTIVGLDPNARYSWLASGTDLGTLSLALDPLSEVEISVSSLNNVVAGDTVVFADSPDDKTITAVTSDPGVKASASFAYSFSSGTNLNEETTISHDYVAATGSGGTIPSFTVTSRTFPNGAELSSVVAQSVFDYNDSSLNPVFASLYIASVDSNDVRNIIITAREDGVAFNAVVSTATILPATSNLVETRLTGNISGGVDGLGASNFLIGTDSEATASHLTSSIGFNDGLSATFAESEDTPGLYIIRIGRSVETVTAVAVNITNAGSLILNPTDGIFPDTGNTTALANIRVYGQDKQFTFPQADYLVAANEVLFVTLPEFSATDTTTVTFEDGNSQFRFSQVGPVAGDVDNQRNRDWNTTNRDLFLGANTLVKSCPIEDFVNNEDNYWIAYRDNSSTIYIRDVGELGSGESANIGHGISNATLSYIGAPNENTATPAYPTVDIINAFATDGAYLAGETNDYNRTIVAQSENLTSAINDLNNHLVSIKDTQYQNLGIRLVDGGFWTWDIPDGQTVNGTLNWSSQAFVQVPGLSDITNTIAADATGLTLLDGEVLFFDIERTQPATPVSRVVTLSSSNVTSMDLFVPQRDRFILARRVGAYVYVGIGSSMRIGDSESSPLDGELSYFGLSGDQLPRQLNSKPNGTMAVDVGNGDIRFRVGGLATASTDEDDFVVLTVPINSGIAFWEGATFDFSGVANNAGMGADPTSYNAGEGKILTQGTTNDTAFRSRTVDSGLLRSFDLATLTADREVWYTIGLSGDTAIVAADPEIMQLEAIALVAVPPISPVIGRNKGEPVVTVGAAGDVSTVVDGTRALIPEFGGELPIVAFRVSADSSGNINDITAGDIVVLGASGGGGGGSGDASSNLDLLLDRFNLAPYEYISPLVASIDALTVLDSDNGNEVGVSSSSYAFNAGDDLVTIDLLDNDFLSGNSFLSKIDIMSIWADVDGEPSIDPNARYFITQDPANKTSSNTNEDLVVPVWSTLLTIPETLAIAPPISPVSRVSANIFALSSASAIVPCKVIVSLSTTLTISLAALPIANPVGVTTTLCPVSNPWFMDVIVPSDISTFPIVRFKAGVTSCVLVFDSETDKLAGS